MMVDDDRVYPRDALETYLYTASYCLGGGTLFFAVQQCREVWIGVTPRWPEAGD
jgi:hypothetical protein